MNSATYNFCSGWVYIRSWGAADKVWLTLAADKLGHNILCCVLGWAEEGGCARESLLTGKAVCIPETEIELCAGRSLCLRGVCVSAMDLQGWHAAAVWGAAELIIITRVYWCSIWALTVYVCAGKRFHYCHGGAVLNARTHTHTHTVVGGSSHACLHIKHTRALHTPVSKLAPSSQAFFRLLQASHHWLSCQWMTFCFVWLDVWS